MVIGGSSSKNRGHNKSVDLSNQDIDDDRSQSQSQQPASSKGRQGRSGNTSSNLYVYHSSLFFRIFFLLI